MRTGRAMCTLQKALDPQHPAKGGLILHSNQGSQYTSKAFIESCGSVHVSQSMSKAGYLYDNAPMERYFNTLKNECTNLYEFRTEEELYQTVEGSAYATFLQRVQDAIRSLVRRMMPFQDSEPEGKQPPRRGMPLTAAQRDVTLANPMADVQESLFLSPSPSVRI